MELQKLFHTKKLDLTATHLVLLLNSHQRKKLRLQINWFNQEHVEQWNYLFRMILKLLLFLKFRDLYTYHTNIKVFQVLISIKLSIAQISTKDSPLKMELLRLFHIHKLVLIATLIMVLLRNLVHSMYHIAIQD